ncbi:MAG: tRNA-uridine aminocarboxypropyltransferase [Myxococcota bacterium]
MQSPPPPTRVGNRCYRCHRAVSACWCATVTPLKPPVQVNFLQHPREARNPIGTLHMAHQALPGSRLFVGVDFSEDAQLRALVNDTSRRHALLYPGPDAQDAGTLRITDEPLTLWVIDGTWWQARKVFQANPLLHALPRYRLQPSQPGQYRIRKEPAAHCLSTVEAVAALLDALEGAPGRYASMLTPFHAMVEHQLSFAEAPTRTPRHRRQKRPRRRLMRTLEALGPDESHVVLVHGEGTGWPVSVEGAPPAELLQWTAFRPATGETFHAFIRSQHGVSPHALEHQGLTPEMLAQAVEPREFVARWRAWSREDDRWCVWGFHGTKLARGHGITLPTYADLRTACCAHLRSRVGLVEEAHPALQLTPAEPLAPARGGRRLAQMAAVYAELRRRERPPA